MKAEGPSPEIMSAPNCPGSCGLRQGSEASASRGWAPEPEMTLEATRQIVGMPRPLPHLGLTAEAETKGSFLLELYVPA